MSKLALTLIAEEKKLKTGYLELGNCGITPNNMFLTEVWKKLEELTHLETLILSNEWWDWDELKFKNSNNEGEKNFLEKIPISIASLINLKKVILAGSSKTKVWGINKIEYLNSSKNLAYIDLSYNQITKLNDFVNLNKLRHLDISHNKIIELEGIKSLNNIEYLYAGNNPIIKIDSLECFPILKRFDISDTEISDLYPIRHWILMNMPVRWTLGDDNGIWVGGCPLNRPPMHIAQRGPQAVYNYFQQLEKYGFATNKVLKLILIGNTTVGKTSLVNYLMYEEFNSGQGSTHGMQITAWLPEKLKGIKINVWDFGGQEYYHATHRLFLSNNAVYVLLWNEETNTTGTVPLPIHIEGVEGEQLRDFDVFPYQYWLESIRYYYEKGDDIFLVQNKVNQPLPMPEKVLDQYKLSRDKEFHICLKKANNYRKLGEGKKRSWTDYETFKETLIETLTNSVAEYDLVSYWIPILEAILVLEENYLPLSDFERICQEAVGKEVEIAFDLLIIYLRDIASVILYYEEDENLKDTVFIKPNWLNQNIYKILNYAVLGEYGEFDRTHVVDVLEDESQARQFVALMKEFGLIFDLPDEEGKYVAPQYLPDEYGNPRELRTFRKHIDFQHAFTLHFPKFLPKSVMTRFLSKYGSKAKDHLYWKYGIGFYLEEKRVYATYNFEEREIKVEVQDGSKHLAGLVFQTLYKIINNGVDFKIALRENEEGESMKNIRRYNLREYNHLIKKQQNMKKVFISYSKHDREKIENELKSDLNRLEKQGKIKVWYDQDILPGEEWDAAIKEKLHDADIILLMVSRKFLATDYIWDVEIKKAVRRHNKGDAVVIPIILSPCLWTGDTTSFSKLNALPSKGVPISKFDDEDEAWTEVLQGIKKLLT